MSFEIENRLLPSGPGILSRFEGVGSGISVEIKSITETIVSTTEHGLSRIEIPS
jgi:hypothetical protein